MVHAPTLEAMQKELRDNLQQYVKEHSGEFVLLEGGPLGIITTFYKTKGELEKATEKYKGLFGLTFLSRQIPVKTHRFNKNNKTLEFLDDYLEVCPNDEETKLLSVGVTTTFENGKRKYREIAYCPDCGCQVSRKPSQETIRKVEENMKKPFIAS